MDKVLQDFPHQFSGFETLQYYSNNIDVIPQNRGVYIILSEINSVEFVEPGSGGFFKKRNPNVSIEMLQKRWINDASIIYIGQAGRKFKEMTLQKRIQKLIQFGQGRNSAHFEGRYIWQIKESHNLKLAWLETDLIDNVKNDLLKRFYKFYSYEPFANLRWNMTNSPTQKYEPPVIFEYNEYDADLFDGTSEV